METKDIKQLVRPNILAMAPYSTARDECEGNPDIFLDANESPYNNGFNRYPDPHQKLLKQKIAEIKGIPAERVFIGNGSDEAIDLAYRVFCRPGIDNAVSIAPTYGMYGVAAATNDIEFREVQLEKDFSLDTAALLAATDENTKLIFICSPNNPTGNRFPEEQICEILSGFKGIVIVDEAYIDFASEPGLAGRLGEFPNLVILQTFSKAWGMAGLRVGLALADPFIISLFSNVKYPYNINGLTQKIVLKKIESGPVRVRETVGERERIIRSLENCPGVIKAYPSEANFILVKFKEPESVYRELLDRKIIVRDRSKVRGCEGCLRISVGTPSENDALIHMLWNPAGSVMAADNRIGTDREATIFRTTTETGITVLIDLDGKGPSYVSTGIGFFDHMLDQISHHSGISLLVEARGDLNVDTHHTVEDVAIVLGEAVSKALGSKAGIGRYGFALPMDESEASVLLDLGGRIDFSWEASFNREKIGDMPTEMFRHFFKSFAESAKCNLHIKASGENEHHKIEGIFKAFARSLKMAIAREKFQYSVPSSKGVL